MRTCLGCREHFPREELVRVVCDPEGRLFVDRYLRAPGRGAHLCYNPACVEAAVKRRAFQRAFHRPVETVEAKALMDSIVESIEVRIRDGLGLARRASAAVTGLDELERRAERLDLLVISNDVAENSLKKLYALAGRAQCPVVLFSGDRFELGRIVGRPERVAVGLSDPTIAARLLLEFGRRDRVLVAA